VLTVTSRLFPVALNGIAMNLRPSELESVAVGLGEFAASAQGNLRTLTEALQQLPPSDRAPVWELAMRRFGRHKPLPQAAGEIGMDEIRARDLIERFCSSLAAVPPPER
jgi:hypothetical protein